MFFLLLEETICQDSEQKPFPSHHSGGVKGQDQDVYTLRSCWKGHRGSACPHSPTGPVMLELFDVTVQIHHVKSCIWPLSLIPQSVVPVPLHYFLMNPQKPQPLLYRPAPVAERHMFCSFPYISNHPSVLNGIALDELKRDTKMLGNRFKIFIVHVPGTGKDYK